MNTENKMTSSLHGYFNHMTFKSA